MKLVKIILAAVVVGLIVFFVIKSSVNDDDVHIIDEVESNDYARYRNRIEGDIKALSSLPEDKFCKNSYLNVKSIIDDFSKAHPPQFPHGRLGKTQLENEQWKENFSKNLYSVYVDLFIRQSFYVFGKSDWQSADVVFVRDECKSLKKSQFLKNESPVYKSLSQIQQILGKYYEINNFIMSSRSFPLPEDMNRLGIPFPFSDLQAIISRIDAYKNNNLENHFVNNFKQLHTKLDSNKQRLIDIYLAYLETKIQNWVGKYPTLGLKDFREYREIVYDPLFSEIIDFRDNCYYNDYTYNKNRLSNIERILDGDSVAAFNDPILNQR